jgi:hypothetical protein
MDHTLEVIEAEALKLTPGDRSRLAERLLASLDEEQEIEASWDAVADEREAAIGPSSAGVVSFDAAFARLEARFPG